MKKKTLKRAHPQIHAAAMQELGDCRKRIEEMAKKVNDAASEADWYSRRIAVVEAERDLWKAKYELAILARRRSIGGLSSEKGAEK